MSIIDIILSIIFTAFLFKFLKFLYNKKPSDKYHNDSWKTKNKK